jgi:hypothetical protein
MNNEELHAKLVGPLWDDVIPDDEFYVRKPLLAHYTTLETLEKIVINNEVWFSNPLLMNDLEELIFGINEGANRFHDHSGLREACGSESRFLKLQAAFNVYYDKLAQQDALDLYVLCLSEHAPGDKDGLLSMWRGYGGNGKGVAIVFDTSKIETVDGTPFMLGSVHYASSEERFSWIDNKLNQLAMIIKQSHFQDDQLYLAADAFFDRLKVFALFTKHAGFREENEWRVVYLQERDTDGRLASMFDYVIGPKGVEPKLKFKIGPVDGATGSELSLDLIVDHVILGPSSSGILAVHAIKRMLERMGHIEIANSLRVSSTPFRAT